MSENGSPHEHIDWTLTTWELARREQMRRWSQMSLAEITASLEDMQMIADQLSRSARLAPGRGGSTA
jgi:hypothetical protein